MAAAKIGELGYEFRFPVESREGQDERRRHNTLRKQAKREAHRRKTEPPPLPSAAPGVVDANQAPPGSEGSGVAVAPVAPPSEPDWTSEDVREFTDELIETLETSRVEKYGEAARELNLGGETVKEFERDAKYPPTAKAGLKRSTPEVTASVLNIIKRHTGVGPKFKHPLNFLKCAGQIWLNNRKLDKKLDELLANQKKLLEGQGNDRQGNKLN